MREWLNNLSDIDLDCVGQYEFLLGRKLSGHEEYTEIDSQVDEMILEWEDRAAFFAAYPSLRKYAQEHEQPPAAAKTHGLYEGILPNPAKPGYRGYYPVTSSEEWEALPDLYKVMEWDPVPDPQSKGNLRAVKAVVFDVVHLEPYGIRAKVSVHPEELQKILFCSFGDTACQLYTVCGVELEGGSRLSAKWLQDSTTGAFGIFVNGNCVGRQGGFQGYIPEHMKRLPDGSFRFDFRYGVGKTVHYELSNPFRNIGKVPSLEVKLQTARAQTPRNEAQALDKPESFTPER